MPTVLTIILNYRTAEMTLSAAKSAVAAMEGIDGEVLIVDNASQDGSFEALSAGVAAQGWSDVRVLQTGHNGGFGAGNNFGIRAGLSSGQRPDYIYILNSDAFPAKTAIRALLDHLEAHPEAGFAGSYIHGPDGQPHQTCFRFPTLASEFERAANTGPISRLLANYVVAMEVPAATGPVDWLAGASVMMRQSVLDEIGLFDETFFLYFEETDLCRRLTDAGGSVHFVRESEVEHIGSVSTGLKTWTRVPQYWFRSRFHYFSKHHGRAYAATATILQVLGSALFRLRRLISPKTSEYKPHFLRDMVRHDISALLGRSRG